MAIVWSRLGPSRQTRQAFVRTLQRPRKWAAAVSRTGLAARTGFYLLLVYLIVRLAVASHATKQPNANGAITTVARGTLGVPLLVITALGFAGFGLTRLWVASRDRDASVWTNVRTIAQGLFYLALAWVPLSYALGNHQAGREQQQHKTVADLLHLPGGRVIVFVVGLGMCAISAYQVKSGLDRDYVDGMAIDDAPPWVRRAVLAAGVVGVPARALVFLPIGVFFMIAAVQGDASRADGLDRELTALTGNPWGDVVLALVVIGLSVFVVFSALETRYREVTRNS